MLKLNLQYFGHLTWRTDSLEKKTWWERLRAGGQGGDRMKWLDGLIDSEDMRLSKLHKIVRDREAWHAAVHGVAKSWTWLRDWTKNNTNVHSLNNIFFNIRVTCIYTIFLYILACKLLTRTQYFFRVCCCLAFKLKCPNHGFWASWIAQLVKNPPARQETFVWFLGWEDLLKKR